MMRLAILGNSHLAALRLAWRTLHTQYPGVEITFFGGIAPVFNRMSFDARGRFGLHDADLLETGYREQTLHSFGALALDLSGFDALALCGWRYDLGALAQLADMVDIDGLLTTGAERRLSRPAFEAMIRALAEASVPDPAWQERVRAPRFLLPRPRPPRHMLDSGAKAPSLWVRLTARNVAPVLAAMDRALGQAGAAQGWNVCVQPPRTLAACGLTDDPFSINPPRFGNLNRARPTDDCEHMNATYGAAVLADLLAHPRMPRAA